MEMLKILRNSAGISQQKLATTIGVSRSTVAMWETGQSQPDNTLLKVIAEHFHVSVDYLLKDSVEDEEIAHARKIVSKLYREQDPPIQLLEEQLGVNYATFKAWCNGLGDYFNNASGLLKLAEFFNVSIDYLLGREPAPRVTTKGVKIPVLGYVRAGIPIDAVEEILDYEEITEEMASQGTYFALQIKGDSMEPRIREGDVVIVRQQETVDSGDTAIVLVNGNDATVKKVKIAEDGITLIPNNQAYDVTFYSKKEVEEIPVRIIGKVVELRGKF